LYVDFEEARGAFFPKEAKSQTIYFQSGSSLNEPSLNEPRSHTDENDSANGCARGCRERSGAE
jgi:hypothetical protein